MSKLSSKFSLGLSSNCDQIHNSPINTSKTKQLYSFPKSTRFGNPPKQNCDSAYYYLPSTRAYRSTSFGYGNKSDFTSNQSKFNPAPNTYQNIVNSFENKQHPKGFSFGLSREVFNNNKNNTITKDLKEQGVFRTMKNSPPGPGTYQLKSTLSDLKYTLRPKTNNPQDKTTNKQVPGPGTYPNISSISKNGKQFLSKLLSSGATTFNPISSIRFKGINKGILMKNCIFKDLQNFPAPNHYHPKTNITPEGQYFVSKFHSSSCRSFPKVERTYFQIQKGVPGPGSYRAPSDFGYYDQVL